MGVVPQTRATGHLYIYVRLGNVYHQQMESEAPLLAEAIAC